MNITISRRFILIAAVVALIFGASACGKQTPGAKAAGRAQGADQVAVGNSVKRLTKNQPIHTFTHSQIRATLQFAEDVQANGVISTSYGYSHGTLIWWCPSIGAPVPGSYQLSGSTQWVDLPGDGTKERFQVDQPESTGVYTHDTTSTWTICVDDNGKMFGKYSELEVDSTMGVVKGLPPDKRVRVDQIDFEFKLAK